MVRRIIHVDMNAFYASCHQAQNPDWRGKPLVVAGDPERRRGIVLTASYEARRYGVKTAMPVGQARRLCPQGIFIPPDHGLYLGYSRRILEVLFNYTPLVEPYSIDEAWLDVTGSERLYGTAEDIGRAVQRRIREELGIPCSVGISVNKYLAKMASERLKPNGFTVLSPADIPRKIWPLPVDEMVGVGKKLAPRLREMGACTIGRLAAMPVSQLAARFGLIGETLHRLAHGQDDSPVDPSSLNGTRSLGHSLTLPRDIDDPEDVARVLLALSEQVGRRLRQHGYLARTVTLTVRDHNFTTFSRSRTLFEATFLTETIYRTATDIYRCSCEPRRKIRLLGVSVSNLLPDPGYRQLCLFGRSEERLVRLTMAADGLRNRYGETVLQRARLCEKKDKTGY